MTTSTLPTRGKLIVFEGIDGSGKSTQIQLLAENLKKRGIDVVTSFEPTRGPWGMRVRNAAQGERLELEDEINCLLEDRREHVHQLIEPSLTAGKWVLLDRYYPSMMAYQGASGANVENIRLLNEEFATIPDLALWLDIPLEQSIRRIGERGPTDAFENIDLLRACREVYASMDIPWFQRVDGSKTAPEIALQILSLVFP